MFLASYRIVRYFAEDTKKKKEKRKSEQKEKRKKKTL